MKTTATLRAGIIALLLWAVGCRSAGVQECQALQKQKEDLLAQKSQLQQQLGQPAPGGGYFATPNTLKVAEAISQIDRRLVEIDRQLKNAPAAAAPGQLTRRGLKKNPPSQQPPSQPHKPAP